MLIILAFDTPVADCATAFSRQRLPPFCRTPLSLLFELSFFIALMLIRYRYMIFIISQA